MNRMKVPRQHRRYSLPTLSHGSLGASRAVPEGSDTFQKALEELYSYEPNHVPPKVTNETSLNGLSNIQEGDEDAYEDDDDPIEEVRKLNRRHSSPSFFGKDEVDGFDEVGARTNEKAGDNSAKSAASKKRHTSARKEYFIKHGHWPEDKTKHAISGKTFSLHPNRTQTSVAFGSSSSRPAKFAL